MSRNIYIKNDEFSTLKLTKNHLSIFEITERALFTEFLMNENEAHAKMVCERCMVLWENYFDYLAKYFQETIPNWLEQEKLV